MSIVELTEENLKAVAEAVHLKNTGCCNSVPSIIQSQSQSVHIRTVNNGFVIESYGKLGDSTRVAFDIDDAVACMRKALES